MTRQETSTSYLSTVRIWLEEVAGDESEWRGNVQHVLSGEARYFRNWPTLLAFLLETVPEPHARQGMSKPLKE